MVEKALHDLNELGETGDLKNPLVTKSLESKLPEVLKKEWLVYAAEKKDEVGPKDRFNKLLTFLRSQEEIYEQLEQLRDDEPNRRELKIPPKHTRKKATKSMGPQMGCVILLYYCKKFKALNPAERKAAASRIGACGRCLEVLRSTLIGRSVRPLTCAGVRAVKTSKVQVITTTCAPGLEIRAHPRGGQSPVQKEKEAERVPMPRKIS